MKNIVLVGASFGTVFTIASAHIADAIGLSWDICGIMPLVCMGVVAIIEIIATKILDGEVSLNATIFTVISSGIMGIFFALGDVEYMSEMEKEVHSVFCASITAPLFLCFISLGIKSVAQEIKEGKKSTAH